jgi:asparagine synthase (glutamine-hydrolysing)
VTFDLIVRQSPDDPVKRADTMTMACGLKARVPFLDQDLVEPAAACPPELKTVQSGRGTLKDLGRKVLPSQMIDRPTAGPTACSARRPDC